MNLLEEIKIKFSQMSLLQKIMAIILLPLTIIALLMKAKNAIDNLIEDRKRKQVDQKDQELQAKIEQTEKQVSKEEGKLESLQEAKQEAVKESESQDPVSFHNLRKKKE